MFMVDIANHCQRVISFSKMIHTHSQLSSLSSFSSKLDVFGFCDETIPYFLSPVAKLHTPIVFPPLHEREKK
jgi:hypothetical protein